MQMFVIFLLFRLICSNVLKLQDVLVDMWTELFKQLTDKMLLIYSYQNEFFLFFFDFCKKKN